MENWSLIFLVPFSPCFRYFLQFGFYKALVIASVDRFISVILFDIRLLKPVHEVYGLQLIWHSILKWRWPQHRLLCSHPVFPICSVLHHSVTKHLPLELLYWTGCQAVKLRLIFMCRLWQWKLQQLHLWRGNQITDLFSEVFQSTHICDFGSDHSFIINMIVRNCERKEIKIVVLCREVICYMLNLSTTCMFGINLLI